MKYTTESIELDGKTYKATEVDYNSYTDESASITLDNKTYSAIMKKGIEKDYTDTYKVTQNIVNGKSELVFEKVESGTRDIYDVTSTILINNTQELSLIGG